MKNKQMKNKQANILNDSEYSDMLPCGSGMSSTVTNNKQIKKIQKE